MPKYWAWRYHTLTFATTVDNSVACQQILALRSSLVGQRSLCAGSSSTFSSLSDKNFVATSSTQRCFGTCLVFRKCMQCIIRWQFLKTKLCRNPSTCEKLRSLTLDNNDLAIGLSLAFLVPLFLLVVVLLTKRRSVSKRLVDFALLICQSQFSGLSLIMENRLGL